MATITEYAKAVWGTLVTRGGKKVSALQEVADAKTQATIAADNTKAILAKLANPAPAPVTMTPADQEAVATLVAAKLKFPTKGTITLQ